MSVLKYALSGVARSGATPSGYLPKQYAQLWVNSVNRTKYFDKLTWDVDDELNDQPNILTIDVFGFTPNLNEVVTLYNTTGKEFEGRIIDAKIDHDRKTNRFLWRCKAQDYTWDLDGTSVTGRYTGSATLIGAALQALAPAGFTGTHIAAGLPSVDEIQFTFTPLSQAFRQLADRFGGDFYVDYNKDIHLFLTETAVTPKTLNTSNPDWRQFSFERSSQGIQNRIYCQGGGSTLLASVDAGETILPIESGQAFAAGGGQAITANNLISYTGKTQAAPTTIMGATLKVGAGLSVGVYDYAYTYITAAGESLPSPQKVITAGLLAPPTVPSPTLFETTGNVDSGAHQYATTFITADGETLPSGSSSVVTTGVFTMTPPNVPALSSGGGGSLTPFHTYFYEYTFVTASGETTPGPWKSIVLGSGETAVGVTITTGPPNCTARNIYRWDDVANFRLVTTVADNTTTFYIDGAASVAGNPVAPGVNTATADWNQVSLIVLTGPTGVTQRKLYRTAAGGSQLKLLTTIADNTTGLYIDNIADASLGANAPTVGTAVQEQVSLTAIAVGPSGTTQRKVYRTTAGGAQYKLLTTIADNVTTTYTDSTADASLGANSPTTDTSGLTILKSSTTSGGSTAAGSTTMTLASSTGFPTTGWVAVTTQMIRYTGVAGNQLTGIPASGNGSIQASIPTSTIVDSVQLLTGIPASGAGSLASSVASGSEINLMAQADDATSQATYGVRVGYVVDRRLAQAGADARAAAELEFRASALEQGSYVTNDILVRSGRRITVDMNTDWSIAGTWTAQRARVQMDANRPMAERTVEFASQSPADLTRIIRQLERQQTET